MKAKFYGNKNSKIIITGSAGFIGFHVAKKLLEEGRTVIGVDNMNDYYDPSLKEARNKILQQYNSYTFYQVDITDNQALESIFRSHKIDKICHLAAQAGVRYSLENPYIYVDVNIKGFLNILEMAKKYKVKDVVYASSSSVYGNNAMSEGGFSEKDEVSKQISLYGFTKRANELLAYTYHHLYQMNFTGLRFFTVYGPWGRPDMAYFSFTKAILEGRPIKVYNFGKMKRDFTYIDDAVYGVIKALDQPYPYEIFNIGNSHTVELNYFIQCLENEVGKKAIIDPQPLQPGDVLETFANLSHASKMLDFTPTTKIEEGLRKFVRWYKDYFHRE